MSKLNMKPAAKMSVGKSKVISSGPGVAVRGGSGHMTGNKVGTQTPGQTATKPTNTGGKFAKGGSGHMVGRTGVNPSVAGKVNVNGGKALGGTGSGGGRRGTGTALDAD